MADKSATRYCTHKFSEFWHEGSWLVVTLFAHSQEFLEVFVVDLLLTWKIYFQCLTGEQAIETFPIINVGFAIQENPIGRSKDFGSDVYDSRLHESGRIEDFSGKISLGCDDNKSAWNVSVEFNQEDADMTDLWKTETQLKSALSHLALYFLKSGLTDSKKGPIKGIFQAGPTMPYFLD